MRRYVLCFLVGLGLTGVVPTGASGGEEPVDLSKLRGLFLEDPVCGPHFEVFADHFEPAINGLPGPEDAEDLEAALYAILAQNVFACSFLQFLAATAIGDREINAELRELGLAVPLNPDRVRAAFRRLAIYDANTGNDVFDGPSELMQVFGFAVPDGLEDARLWAESLDAMTAETLLAEARRHQALDDDLAKYLERMAALKGSREAAVLVARRALADPDFGFDYLLAAYLLRAIDAGAVDLEPAVDRVLRRLFDREQHRADTRDYLTSEDFSLDDKLLWR